MGLAFCSIQLLTQVLSLTSKKCCHVGVHVILGLYDFLFYYETVWQKVDNVCQRQVFVK